MSARERGSRVVTGKAAMAETATYAPRLLVVGVVWVVLCLSTAMDYVSQAAAAAGPGWSINSEAEPTRFNSGETINAVQVIAVRATGGTYSLKALETSAGETSEPINFDEPASQLQEKLEAIAKVGKGNIEVSGGPGDENGDHPYTITWIGAFTGSSLGPFELRENLLSGGEKTVVQESRVTPEVYDRYTITATNSGSQAASGIVTITDKLPSGIIASRAQIEARPARRTGECTVAVVVTCEYVADPEHQIAPGGKVVVTLYVGISSPSLKGSVVNEATVAGGGGHEAATTEVSQVNEGVAQFGIDQFTFEAAGGDGMLDTQAGSRPFGVTTSLSFDSIFTAVAGANAKNFNVPQEVKNVDIELPLGFIGNPLAAKRCPEVDMDQQTGVAESGRTACDPASIIGEVWLTTAGEGGWLGGPFPLYNIVPEEGYPAEFGFNYGGFGQPIFLYVTILPGTAGYSIHVAVPGALRYLGREIERTSVTIFGDPGERNGEGSNAAFATNPSACSTSLLTARAEVTSWEGGADRREAIAYPQIAGCELLQGAAAFGPRIAVTPQESVADTPSGYEIAIKMPQAPAAFGQLATPELKNASVTLPVGVALSPAAANGVLEACSPTEIGLMSTEIGAGHPGGNGSRYDDGLTHASPGHCPDGSRVGDVEVETPLLEEPLKGHVYVAQSSCGGEAQPECTAASAENGELFGLYLELSGAGVILKLHGKMSVNAHTGQITTSFTENPQLPFEELRLKLYDGQRATLANPQTCGTATTTSEFEPWSAPGSGPNATSSWPFMVSGCVSPMPFAPTFSAGTTQALGGAFSSFTLDLTRKDGEQDFGGISVTFPPGLSGMTSKVARCGEADANAGTCPESSRIGTAHAAAGSGSQPLWLEGPVYFTGPYHGAPFGLSVVIPTKAGPFNLGSEVVRSAISVDPRTAQATTTTEPLRLIRDGVPFRLKTIRVTIDRPGFIFNPTNCSQQQLTGSIVGDLPDGSPGSRTAVSSPFAVAGCRNLPFHPSFKLSTEGATGKRDGASLDVRVKTASGSANIREVHVSLPKQLPSRLETLKLACIDMVFESNPATCPSASAVGMATAVTPIFARPLVGPAYLVSHGGTEFPDLEIVLQAEGVTLVLDGKTDIKKSITTSTFNTVPDAPVSSFELKLPKGPHSVLGAPGGKLCSASLVMPTIMRGQNGALVEQRTKVAVTGCKPAIDVLRHSVRASTATITARVPSAGVLVGEAVGLSRAVKRLGRAGSVTLKLKLTNAEHRFLAVHPGRLLQARVKLRFRPNHGKPLSAGVTVLIG